VECRILIVVNAWGELKRCAGTQFDPELVEVFLLVLGNERVLTADLK